MDITSRIFVQIASYRDPECQWTVRDLFEKATNPDRISVGICWQFIPEEDAHCFEFETRPEQVRVYAAHAHESAGVGWARAITQSLWEGEEYTLMIDSHMRFVQGWDTLLFEQLNLCERPERSVLSAYPPSYTPPNNLDENPKITVNYPKAFNEFGELGYVAYQFDIKNDKPLVGASIAAGFMFSSANIIKEIPYDPYIYFTGEEVVYSARLFTHGWDMYAPSVVILYHYYNVPNAEKKVIGRRLHHEDNSQWWKLQERARKRCKHLLGTEATDDADALRDIEKYGLGTARTMEYYMEICGVNFKEKTVRAYGD